MEGRHPDRIHEEARKLVREAREAAECVGGIYFDNETIYKLQEAVDMYGHLVREYGPKNNETPLLKEFDEIREEAHKANLLASYLEVITAKYDAAGTHANDAMALSTERSPGYHKGRILKTFILDQKGKDTTIHWGITWEGIEKHLGEDDAGRARCHNFLGRLHQAKGNWEAAIDNFGRAVSFDPDLDTAFEDLDNLYDMEETFYTFEGSAGITKEMILEEASSKKQREQARMVPALEIIADSGTPGGEYLDRTNYFYRLN